MNTNYICPECSAEITQEQLNAKGMCPNCGCPASTIRAVAEAEQAKEQRDRVVQEAQKEAAAKAKLPKTPDDRYKTTASKLLIDIHATRVNLELLNENKEG